MALASTHIGRMSALKWLPPVALPQGELQLPTASPGALRDEQVGLTQALSNYCIHTETWSV